MVSQVLITSLLKLKCHVIFHPSLNCCSYPFQYLKSMPIFWDISTAFISIFQLSTTILFKHGKTIQTGLIASLHKSLRILKYHPLAKPAVQYNPPFLNMLTEWRVGFRMPGLFHFYLFNFYPLL